MSGTAILKGLPAMAAAMALSASGCCHWCCMHGRKTAPATQPSADASREPVVLWERTPKGDANNPGAVNIFGEMRGIKAGPVRTISEANFQQHTYLDDGYDADVALDPSGKWLAFASTRDSDHTNICMQRVDGTAVIQLTSDVADDAYPAFSPDSKQIAFASTRAGNWQIFVMDVDGKNVTQITTGPMQAIHPSWSPDGSRIVYCTLGSKSQQWELWTVHVASNERRMIGYGLFPSWSPSREADRIAFQRPRQRGSRWFSIWTLELVDGEARRITEVAVSSNSALLWPTWSPDGKRIAFASIMEPGNPLAPGSHSRGRTDIWAVDADGSDRQRLTDGTGVNLMPFWGPDNRVYFISDRGGAECVWSARVQPARVQTVDGKANPPKVQEADTHEAEH